MVNLKNHYEDFLSENPNSKLTFEQWKDVQSQPIQINEPSEKINAVLNEDEYVKQYFASIHV